MTGLRWLIGIVTSLVALGAVILTFMGGGFRRSFGASDNSAVIVAVVVLFAGVVVASVVWPDRRPLMHVGAVAMLGLCVACVFVARQTVFVATVGVFYAAMWFILYYRTIWQR